MKRTLPLLRGHAARGGDDAVRIAEDWTSVMARERRSGRRFPIKLDLRYELSSNQRPTIGGRGTTLDVSSGGIFFKGAVNAFPGARISLHIQWPVLLDDHEPLELEAIGRVVRIGRSAVAVKVKRWCFVRRLSSRTAAPQASS
jgi:hypothetical protein